MKLLIDGREVDIGRVSFIYQSDPIPGGHTYELSIPLRDVNGSALESAEFLTCQSPDEDLGRKWFFWLDYIMAQHSDPESCKTESAFVLNNIARVNLDNIALFVAGECSDFIYGTSGI